MLKGAVAVLKAVEWALLLILAGFALLLTSPFSDMYHFDKDIRQAKREGIYFAASGERQTYFDKSLSLDGVIYDQKELLVYMTSREWGPNGNLPNRIQVTTDSGTILESRGSGSSTNVYRSRGYFRFETVPAGIKSITVHQENYGESFTFNVALQGENS